MRHQTFLRLVSRASGGRCLVKWSPERQSYARQTSHADVRSMETVACRMGADKKRNHPYAQYLDVREQLSDKLAFR